MDAFYEPLGDGRYLGTEHCGGPWDPAYQHAGPPAALLGAALEALVEDLAPGVSDAPGASAPSHVLGRVTVEILGPIAVGEIVVSAQVERPGRSVALLAAELVADGRPVARARGWRITRSSVEPTPTPVPTLAPDELPSSGLAEGVPDFPYGRAVEWRAAPGTLGGHAMWTRLRLPLVAGREPTPLERVLAVADSASGVGAVLSWETHRFVNVELTVHVLRPASGEWVLLDAVTELGDVGLARSVISDRRGVVARSAQALLVGER